MAAPKTMHVSLCPLPPGAFAAFVGYLHKAEEIEIDIAKYPAVAIRTKSIFDPNNDNYESDHAEMLFASSNGVETLYELTTCCNGGDPVVVDLTDPDFNYERMAAGIKAKLPAQIAASEAHRDRMLAKKRSK